MKVNQYIQLALATTLCLLLNTAYSFESDISYLGRLSDGGTGNLGETIEGLNGAIDITISEADKVYVAGFVDDAVSVFNINRATNQLEQVQVLKNGINSISGLNGVSALTLAPDGSQLYAASLYDKSFIVFDIDQNGLLTVAQVLAEGDIDSTGRTIDGMSRFFDSGNTDILVSDDGLFVYVANQYAGGAIFQKNSGANTFHSIDPNLHSGLVGTRAGLLTNGHQDLYTVNTANDAVYHYSRDAQTGLLTYVQRIDDSSTYPELTNPRHLTKTQDESLLVVASVTDDSLVVFTRDPADGTISYSYALKNGAQDAAGTTVTSLVGPFYTALNSIDTKLVSVNYDSDSLGLFSFDGTGTLLAEGVLDNNETLGSTAISQLDGPRAVGFTADGQIFVVASYVSDSIQIFLDNDVDEDGYDNDVDVFPEDPDEWSDLDNDGEGDNSDTDIDGDGYNNDVDAFPLNPTEWSDLDNDGEGDNSDTDIDGDGYNNDVDAFPLNPTEWSDLDNDGEGDNSDTDIDGDGYDNDVDAFPLNPTEWSDLDNDGEGDNSDTDIDGDGYDNDVEIASGSNPYDPGSIPDTSSSELPPDPSTQAPVITTDNMGLVDQVSFLFEDQDPIQRSADPTVFVPQQMAVIRGLVLDELGNPLSGVNVSIKDHPEFGYTLSRTDGMFDLAVNGGGVYVVEYEKSNYPEVQRKADVQWQDYYWVDDVALIEYDISNTVVSLNASSYQVAQSSVTSDGNGARSTSIMVPPATQAVLKFGNGSTSPIQSLTLRATEYTVGENGPNKMPGELPPSSGYTFAVELSADEAVSAGAESIVFSQPVPIYVTNFLNFSTGVVVPSGWYDENNAAWIASESGRVIEILDIVDGSAVVDVSGSGPATTTELDGLGITAGELQSLALNYVVGDSLWRVPVDHFTAYDFNWPEEPPEDAEEPEEEPEEEEPEEDPCEEAGSIIECENQILGEKVPLVGTNMTLNYRSDRVYGHLASRTLHIPLTGETIPASLMGVKLQIEIAGKRIIEEYEPAVNLSYEYTWDGNDAYGRFAPGAYRAKVKIGYEYQTTYKASRDDTWLSRFAQPGQNTFFDGDPRNNTVTIWSLWEKDLLNIDAKDMFGMGGWSLSEHHRYIPQTGALYMGDGSRVLPKAISNKIETIAGTGSNSCNGDGGLAAAASVTYGQAIAVDEDGSVIVADEECYVVRRIDPQGVITTIAGTGDYSREVIPDGSIANNTALGYMYEVEFDHENTLHIATETGVYRLNDDGGLYRIAGGGSTAPSNGVNARDINSQISNIDFSNDGTMYFVNRFSNQIMKVSPDGIVYLAAGNGWAGYSDGFGKALDASFDIISGMDIGPNGSIYISDQENGRIRVVSPDGRIKDIAGTGYPTLDPDENVPAMTAYLYRPGELSVRKDGTVYFVMQDRIMMITKSGMLVRFAGMKGEDDYSGDGGPALYAGMDPNKMVFSQMGDLIFYDGSNYRIRKISSAYPTSSLSNYVIASPDGSKVFVFDQEGKHLETRNAINNELLLSFQYVDNTLDSINDPYGNSIDILSFESVGFDIQSAYMNVTQVRYSGNGYVNTITNPESENYVAIHDSGGLLTNFQLPNGLDSSLDYDGKGRLILDTNSIGYSWALSRDKIDYGHEVTKTSALGYETIYSIESLDDGSTKRTVTLPNGVEHSSVRYNDGSRESISADGTKINVSIAPDPVFGQLSPYSSNQTISLPSGKVLETTQSRTVSPSSWSDFSDITSYTETVTVNGINWLHVYELASNTKTVTSPEGRVYESVYDAFGKIKEKRAPGIDTIFYEYDPNGRLESISQGTGANLRNVTYSYRTSDGFLDKLLYADQTWMQFLDYDLAGRAYTQAFSSGYSIGYSYNELGLVNGIQPPGKPIHEMGYTYTGETKHHIQPDIGNNQISKKEWVYDVDRRLDRIDLPDSTFIDYVYVPETSQLDRITWNDLTIDYSYYPTSGKLSTSTSPYGVTLNYSYDGKLLTGEQWSGNVSGEVEKIFNENLLIESDNVNGQYQVAYQYDNDGLLYGAGDITFVLDPITGRRSSSTISNSSSTYGYNTFGQLDYYSFSNSGSDKYEYEIIQRDLKGRIVDVVETVSGISTAKHFDYDPSNRLWKVFVDGVLAREYGYDANGNRTHVNNSQVATYDNRDRLENYNGVAFGYDENGNRTSKTSATETTTYNTDVFGNLTEVILPNETINYLADSRGRRVAKLKDGLKIQGFLYKDKLNPIAELDGNDAVVSRFVYASKKYVPDYMIKGGVTYRIITDYVGSVRLVVNASDGSIAQQIEYDEFGKVLTDSNPGFQPFGFAGGLYDHETGLVRFGARDYDPDQGRWLSVDPILFEGKQTNLYVYVNNDPVNFIDPTGESPCDWLAMLPEWLDVDLSIEGGSGIAGGIGVSVSQSGIGLSAKVGVGGGLSAGVKQKVSAISAGASGGSSTNVAGGGGDGIHGSGIHISTYVSASAGLGLLGGSGELSVGTNGLNLSGSLGANAGASIQTGLKISSNVLECEEPCEN